MPTSRTVENRRGDVESSSIGPGAASDAAPLGRERAIVTNRMVYRAHSDVGLGRGHRAFRGPARWSGADSENCLKAGVASADVALRTSGDAHVKRRFLIMAASLLWLPLTSGPLAGPAQARGASVTATTSSGTTLSFSGYSWSVKGSTEPVGPGPNFFSDRGENVWVDSAGQLHLRTTYRDGQWRSAEVILNQSLGYGKYTFNVASTLGNLDPNVVLGLFTWSDDPAYNYREIDVEFARWGNPTDPTNAQYVVQPYDRAGNLRRFVQPLSGPSIHGFTWAPRSVAFSSRSAAGDIASWRYTGRDVPRQGGERVHINLWLNGGTPPLDGAETEVVVSGFTFTR